ncbi:GET complex subunit get1 [Aspergillus tubingensis]|uniref:GET complex subunit get1 n=1 Tax=Aspergillus tubingensis TaxID=5068 RepID=A0A9W6AN80_ASPTU|nr:GET complex subunit get1 [Aspergillus tubingensis]GLA70547.1 GET complex subunit get1 [Aspergillus tubingensis]GLA82520.1 GET complex subunit get1 [Aspergillus tubingensis]GLA95806.1 GET complex subunit get1 [Aspergillus tubingensis]GLB04340.1 GET complex subunit get1 [Aspergillus tubingensis]
MLSLLWSVFFVHVAIYLVNTIGASTIDNLLWLLYLKVPTSTSKKYREQNRLKREVVQLKRDMNNTSSQDEFAKWAKLRRKHDKTMEEYEAINKQLSSQKTSFDWGVKIVRWFGTSGLKFFLQFWYSKTPVFHLPEGWLPYYVAWVLSFPRAPMGSVSIQIWSNVCATAITTMAEVVTAVLLQRATAAAAAPAAKKTQ